MDMRMAKLADIYSLIAAVLLTLVCCKQSDSGNESGSTVASKDGSTPGEACPDSVSERRILNLEKINVGDSIDLIEQQLGQPADTFPSGDDTEARIYNWKIPENSTEFETVGVMLIVRDGVVIRVSPIRGGGPGY